MGAQTPFYLEYLKSQFDKRLEKNTHYSLRSFARWLSIDPSFLSKVFSRQKVLSLEFAEKIVTKLEPLDKGIRDQFIKSVANEQACYSLNKFDPSLTECSNHETN